MMASRERKDREVVVADSQRPAWTGILPYGVAGEIAANRDVSSELKKEKKKKSVRTKLLSKMFRQMF